MRNYPCSFSMLVESMLNLILTYDMRTSSNKQLMHDAKMSTMQHLRIKIIILNNNISNASIKLTCVV